MASAAWSEVEGRTSAGVAAKRTTRGGIARREDAGGGGLLDAADKSAGGREIGVGDAVGDVGERDERHGGGVAADGGLREREGEPGEDEGAEDGLGDALAAGEIAERGEGYDEQRGGDGEEPEPGGGGQVDAVDEGEERGEGHWKGHSFLPVPSPVCGRRFGCGQTLREGPGAVLLARLALSLTLPRGGGRGPELSATADLHGTS